LFRLGQVISKGIKAWQNSVVCLKTVYFCMELTYFFLLSTVLLNNFFGWPIFFNKQESSVVICNAFCNYRSLTLDRDDQFADELFSPGNSNGDGSFTHFVKNHFVENDLLKNQRRIDGPGSIKGRKHGMRWASEVLRD
jgi:hypothetical protein